MVAAALATGLIAHARIPSTDVVVDLRFSRAACCQGTLTADQKSTTFAIANDRDQRIRVTVRALIVHYVSLSLGQHVGGAVLVRRVALERRGHVVTESGGLDVPWEIGRAVFPSAVPDGIFFSLAVPDGVVLGNYQKATDHSRGHRLWLVLSRDPTATLAATTVLASVFGVLVLGIRRRVAPLAALALAVGFILAASVVVPRWRFSDSARGAVGFAAFSGHSKRPELMLHLCVITIAAVAGLLAGVTSKRSAQSRRVALETAGATSVGEAAIAARPLVPVIGAGVILLNAVPSLRTLVSVVAQTASSNWDRANLVFWDWMVARHLVPLRDFWYPYGAQYLFSAALPMSMVAHVASDTALWSYVLLGTFLTLGRRARTTSTLGVAVALFLLLASRGVDIGAGPYVFAPTRYIAGLGIVTMFMATRLDPSPRWRFLTALAVAHVLVLEPAQFLYAVPAIIFAVVEARVRRRAIDFPALGRDTLMLLGGVVLAGIWLGLHRQLGGLYAFYRSPGALTSYPARPSDLVQWLRNPHDLAGWLYWAMPIAALLGMFDLTSGSSPASRGRGLLVFGSALLSFMILQKQVVRPGLQGEAFLALSYALIVWVVDRPAASTTGRSITALGTGAMAGLLVTTGQLGPVTRWVVAGPARTVGDVAFVARNAAELRDSNRSRFSARRFSGFAFYEPVVNEIRRLREGASPDASPVLVLGDDVIFNLLLGEPPRYYYNNFYDVSPLSLQRDMTRRLRRRPPQFAIWNPGISGFDDVPNATRVPLVFSWAVRNLVPVKTLGDFEVLRRRQPAEPVSLAWWAAKLGARFDTGHLMGLGHVPSKRCRDGGRCSQYLIVEYPRTAMLPEGGDVPVTVGAVHLAVHFDTMPGIRRYVLNLHRLWAWSAAARGQSRFVDTPTLGTARIRVVEREPDPSVLY